MWAWLATIGDRAGNMDNRTIQSLPRELSLSDDGNNNLRIQPLRELETLRGDPLVLSDLAISDLTREVRPASAPNGTRIATLESDAVEIRIRIDREQAARKLFGCANGRQALVASHADYIGKRDVTAFTVGAPTTIRKLEIWSLRATNQGFRQAQQSRNWEPRTE
jgi:sucrose-6-phosphate hydrolase SacC (GH32 family)